MCSETVLGDSHDFVQQFQDEKRNNICTWSSVRFLSTTVAFQTRLRRVSTTVAYSLRSYLFQADICGTCFSGVMFLYVGASKSCDHSAPRPVRCTVHLAGTMRFCLCLAAVLFLAWLVLSGVATACLAWFFHFLQPFPLDLFRSCFTSPLFVAALSS